MAGEFTGAVFKFGDGATPTEGFDEIPGIINEPEIGHQGSFIDVTSFSSEMYKEYIGGLKDGADFPLEMNYLMGDTVQEAVVAAADAMETRNFQVVFTLGQMTETATFAVALSGSAVMPSFNNQNKRRINGKITGAITWT